MRVVEQALSKHFTLIVTSSELFSNTQRLLEYLKLQSAFSWSLFYKYTLNSASGVNL